MKKDSHAGGAIRAHHVAEAERIVCEVGAALGLPTQRDELALRKKGNPLKVICAAVVKARTTVGNDRLAQRLAMGHGSYVSTLVQRVRRDPNEKATLRKYDFI